MVTIRCSVCKKILIKDDKPTENCAVNTYADMLTYTVEIYCIMCKNCGHVIGADKLKKVMDVNKLLYTRW